MKNNTQLTQLLQELEDEGHFYTVLPEDVETLSSVERNELIHELLQSFEKKLVSLSGFFDDATQAEIDQWKLWQTTLLKQAITDSPKPDLNVPEHDTGYSSEEDEHSPSPGIK